MSTLQLQSIPRFALGSLFLIILSPLFFGLSAQAGPGAVVTRLPSTKILSAPTGAQGLCEQYPWACARQQPGAVVSERAVLDLAERVNADVNRAVREISDQAQYGVEERWALPGPRGGDCEDFALLKMKRLIEAGVDPKSLRIATALDENRENHAVLLVTTQDGEVVLDNRRSRVLPWQKTGYFYLRAQDAAEPWKWTAALSDGS